MLSGIFTIYTEETMAQKKKSNASANAGKKKSAKSIANWKGRRDDHKSGLIAAIALIGVVAILAGCLLQNSSLFSGAENDSVEGAVKISEFVSENLSALITESGDAPDWVEITNAGNEAVNIGHYALMLESDVTKVFLFPDYSLQPDEYLLVYCDGTNAVSDPENLHAPFKLSASGGDTLILLNAQSRLADAVEMIALDADTSYSRNESGEWIVAVPTPGEANSQNVYDEASTVAKNQITLVQGDLEITEVLSSNTLYYPDENGAYHDYIEIHNTSDRDIDLNGWYLSDGADKLKRWAFPSVTIPAYGYLAVHCSGENRTEDLNHLHTDFRISASGETIYLTQPDGKTVSMVEVPELSVNQAYSYVDGAWGSDISPTPGFGNDVDAAAYVHKTIFGDRSNDVFISEIMASPTGQPYDWIELHNGSDHEIDLSNYGLSDNADKPRKWQFPEGTTIQPGEYMGIFLSGTDNKTLNGYLNVDFALDTTGGYMVTLSDPNGSILDGVYLPQQYGGVSYGRVANEDGFYYFAEATPGSANDGERYRARAKEAEVSVVGGLYHSGDVFTVELSAPAGSRIYYTLDCTDPDESSNLYTGAIEISSTTILRTRVYRDGYMSSYIDTQSYLYDVENEGSVYVVSVVSDPANLFSDETGIMVKGPNALEEYPYGSMNKGANFWMDWEREGHVELFEADGTMGISQGCGLKLHGQYSRACDVKAFKVFARNSYGSNRFEYPIFSNRDYEAYQSFLLRASGQDWNLTFMRDSVLTALAKDTSVMYQETEVGVCYLNGEYYSLYNLRERISKFSICQFEGWEGMEDDIDLVKANSNVKQGSNDTFEELLEYCKNGDPTTREFYDYLDQRIDIQNYIEYMSIEIFVGNGDTLNVKRYRNAKADGKWRWVLFDLDWAFYVDTNSIRRWLTPGGMGTNLYTDNTLFIACMKNPTFRDQFLTYFGQELATTFSTANTVSLFEDRLALIDGLLPAYQEHWGLKASSMTNSMKKLREYCETRPTKILQYFQETFNFSEEEFMKYFGDAVTEIERYEAENANAS